MRAAMLFAGVTLLLTGCTASTAPASSCPTTPTEDSSGYYLGCAYYPGYGWAPRPVSHGSAPGVTG